eukprot:8285858-Pyramimonas_sp.AAC.1
MGDGGGPRGGRRGGQFRTGTAPYFILSYPPPVLLPYPIQSYLIQSDPTLSNPILSDSVSSCPPPIRPWGLPYHIIWHPILSDPIPMLSYPILSHPTLS